MSGFLEFLSCLNWLEVPFIIFETFLHADWRGAARKHGAIGVLGEAGRSLLGTNTAPFFVQAGGRWSAAAIQSLLARHGIRMFGTMWAHGELLFRVPVQQARWADYVMQRAGVPLLYGQPAPLPRRAQHPRSRPAPAPQPEPPRLIPVAQPSPVAAQDRWLDDLLVQVDAAVDRVYEPE